MLTVDCQRALATFGGPSGADIPSKQHNPMAKIATFFWGEDLPQLSFYLLRLLSFGKSQTAADPDAVGIANNTAGNTVEIAQQQICGFSANTGQF